MSASQLSGGYAPSSVLLVPSLATGVDNTGEAQSVARLAAGAQVPNLLVQAIAGVQPAVRAVTEINLVEPPFADFAAPIGNPTQSAFSITVPNGTFGGRTEGAFQIISYADGNVNSINLSIPKPSLLAGQGDNFCGLTGSDQAGQITIPSGATGPVTPVVNAAVLANTPIQFSNNPYTTAGPAAGAGVSVVVTAGVGFTFSVPVAPTADLVINWFIPRY